MTLTSLILTHILSISTPAAQPVFVPAASSPDHCEAAIQALAGTWGDCRVESLKSDATEARPALEQSELEEALAGKPVVVAAKVNAELKIGDKTYQQETAALTLPILAPGDVIWFGKDHFAPPKNAQTLKKGFHADLKIKDLACVADNSAYRYQGVEKSDGSRKFVALFKGTRPGSSQPILYVSGTTHNGNTRFAILCQKREK